MPPIEASENISVVIARLIPEKEMNQALYQLS